MKLLQPDGKQRLSTTAKGKDGSGFSLQTGPRHREVRRRHVLTMMAGPMMYSRLVSMARRIWRMGMLGNPMLYRMQEPASADSARSGLDATAGAASYLMGRR